MVKSKQLSIQIVGDDAGGDVFINGRYYYIRPDDIKTEQDLRNLLQDQPDYVYNAVIALLKEMAL